MARPSVLTPDILLQLKQAFAIGCTDEEACAYANIGTSSFYRFIEKNPEFREESNRLKEQPILKAKQTVVKALRNPRDAQWYLERKKKDEFSPRVEQTGKDGRDLQPVFMVATEEAKKQLEKLYQEQSEDA